MGWPGYPDSFDPGWWRTAVTTPAYYTGTGTLSSGLTTVTGFAATYQGQAITPVAGQQVAGSGIPQGTYVASSPAPTSTAFSLTQAAASSATVTLTMGAQPVTLAEAKQWARVEFADDDNLVADIIDGVRQEFEGPELKRAIMLQARTIYFMGFPWSGGYYNRLIRSMGPNPWWLPTAQGIIMLPYPPLQSVISIQYIDPSSGTLLTISPSTYLFTANSTPGRVQPQYGAVWPLARPVIDAVQITYACGYGANETDVPTPIRLAARAVISATYENRDAYLDTRQLTPTPMFERFLQSENWGTYV